MSEGEGKPPVVVVSDSTNITSGTEVQEKLSNSAGALLPNQEVVFELDSLVGNLVIPNSTL